MNSHREIKLRQHVDGARRDSSRRPGFTLLEMLVVIGIIAALIAILIPAVNIVRESSNTAKCMSNLKQIGTAIAQYAMDHDDCLVPGNTLGLQDGYAKPGFGSWPDILATTRYLPAPLGYYAPGGKLAADPSHRDNVLRCPNGIDTDLLDTGSFPTSQTDARGKFFCVRGSDVMQQAVLNWYGVNTAPRTSANDPTNRQTPLVTIPMGPTGDCTMHKFNQFKFPTLLPMIFDGVYLLNDDSNRINARHGGNKYTNILFADYHCESQATSPLWPDDNWYLPRQ